MTLHIEPKNKRRIVDLCIHLAGGGYSASQYQRAMEYQRALFSEGELHIGTAHVVLHRDSPAHFTVTTASTEHALLERVT